MASLTVRNVTKTFGAVEVLKGISLSIVSGDFLVLVGPSGCGKSTLLNLIAGLEKITSGEIKIGDRIVNNVRPKDRDIAMVFQSYALYPNMNVRQNIAFGLETRKVPKARISETVTRVANILQISDLMDRKPSQLSGGQRQRVAMGRALARDPAIFLFDEPLSNLDAKLRVEMRTEIKLLHQRIKTTIVYVTHDQIEAMTLADRIAIMKDGVIQQFDSPQQIYDNPVNLFVAGFIGSPSMNFIPCRITRHEQRGGVFWKTGDSGAFFLPIDHLDLSSASLSDREVILGIRPEQISNRFPDQKDNPYIHEIESRVEVIEPTGSDTLVFISINGEKVTCRSNPMAAELPGESMKLMVDMSKAVFFDPNTGDRILL